MTEKFIRHHLVFPGSGRHVVHDPQSKDYPARRVVPRSVLHPMYATPLDQGDVGSCTGSSATNLLNCAQFTPERQHVTGTRRYRTQEDAIKFYSHATRIDEWPGEYPPEDTGSSGLAMAKTLKSYGYIQEYRHAFGIDHLIEALPLQPVMVGTTWYSGMTFPEAMYTGSKVSYEAKPTGEYAGGHEYLCIGVNLKSQYLTFVNSWGPDWPAKNKLGRFRISIQNFESLLNDNGDVTVPLGWLPLTGPHKGIQ